MPRWIAVRPVVARNDGDSMAYAHVRQEPQAKGSILFRRIESRNKPVMAAKAGIRKRPSRASMGSRLRGKDGKGGAGAFSSLALALLLGAGSAASAEEVCVRNAYEVPWVHPGITFYLGRDGFACEGLEMPLVKTGETRCVADDALSTDGSWHLSGIDAASGDCVPICDLTRKTTRITFSQSKVYACGD